MRISRQVGFVALALGLAWGAGAAEPFPTHPMRIIVPFAAGGAVDVLGRLAGQQLGEALGQPVVVEDRTGAGGNVGGDAVAKAAPDGYTMLLATTGLLTVNPTIYHAMPFSPSRDLAPVARLATVPNLMVINPELPVHTVAEFIAYAKARPGQLFFPPPGRGTRPPDGRRGPGDVRQHAVGAAAGPQRQAAGAGGDHRDALVGAARRADL